MDHARLSDCSDIRGDFTARALSPRAHSGVIRLARSGVEVRVGYSTGDLIDIHCLFTGLFDGQVVSELSPLSEVERGAGKSLLEDRHD